jgi:hypothetical protein
MVRPRHVTPQNPVEPNYVDSKPPNLGMGNDISVRINNDVR